MMPALFTVAPSAELFQVGHFKGRVKKNHARFEITLVTLVGYIFPDFKYTGLLSLFLFKVLGYELEDAKSL